MPRPTLLSRWFILTLGLALATVARGAEPMAEAQPAFPPGWLPVQTLDDGPAWSDFRKLDDKVHLYLPPKVEAVRGVFVCFVFHSSDPRELARHWRFALVTIPWPFEYDLGVNDKRNGRFQAGHPVGDTRFLLRYLQAAAQETKHSELATAPLVGWLGQNGSTLCADLVRWAPERVLAWSDSFPNRLRQYPELTQAVPFAFAWEISKAEERSRTRTYHDQDRPLADLSCRANTYGFGHGIYSKYNFFAAFLDRCIQLRLPAELPPPGQPIRLAPVQRAAGWVGDFDPVSEWCPIAPAGSPAAQAMKYPCWLPDEYAAWMWRSYHSANPQLKLTGPVVEYRKKDGRWGGPECGLGYGGTLAADKPVAFSAEATGEFVRVEFHDGDTIVAAASQPPWRAEGIKLARGLRVLFAVGVQADGARQASRPAFVLVE